MDLTAVGKTVKDWFVRKNKAPELNREIAASGDGQDITKGYVGSLAYPEDTVLRGRGFGDLKLYEQVLSDEEVSSTLQQRRNAMIAREWKVDAASDSPQDVEAAEFIRGWLNNVGFDRISGLMHYGVFYGYAVAELVYRIEDGKYVADIKVRNRRRFRFTPQGELRLLVRDNQSTGIECPAPYFWHFCTGADHDDAPYGIGLAHWLYWPSMFKRNGVKFWLIFLEKFGMPTAVGRYGKNASPTEQAKLLQATQAIQVDSGIIVPDGMPIELLEASRSGTGDYKSLWDTMNESIRRVVLGQTSSSGGTPGRLGNDDLQEQVLKAIVKADSDVICESFNRGPVKWLTMMNFVNANPPRVYRVFDEQEDLTDKANRNKTIYETTGYRPTLAQLESDFGGEWEQAESHYAPGEPQSEPDKKSAVKNPAGFAAFPHKDEVSSIIDQLEAEDEPYFDDWLTKVRDELLQSDSYEGFQTRLDSLIPHLDFAQYGELLALAAQAAFYRGRYDVVQAHDKTTDEARS